MAVPQIINTIITIITIIIIIIIVCIKIRILAIFVLLSNGGRPPDPSQPRASPSHRRKCQRPLCVAMCNVQCAVCFVKCAMCNVQFGLCSLICVVCSVQ